MQGFQSSTGFLLTSHTLPLQQLKPFGRVTAVIQVLPITQGILGVVQGPVGAVLELVQVCRGHMGTLKNVFICLLHSTQQPGSCLLPQLGPLVLS